MGSILRIKDSLTVLQMDQNVGFIQVPMEASMYQKRIRDSCNYYFSEVGYRLSLQGGTYNEEKRFRKD